MRTYKDTGITFKQTNINEADVIYSILTKYHGRVDAIAKGIRKITSKKAGNIDLMTLSNFSFAQGTNLDIITEVELKNDFTDLKKTLDSTFDLFFLCELLDNSLAVGEDQKYLFNLLMKLMAILEKSKNQAAIISFILKLVSHLGFEPNLSSCIKCNKEFRLKESRFLSTDQVGIVCCGERSNLEVSDKTLKILKFLLNNELEQSEKIIIDSKQEKQLKKIIDTWLSFAFERDFKSKRFLS